MKKEKKIPTILGLLFLIISVVVGVYLSSSKVTFRSKASGDCKPVNVQATNITHNSFAVSFITSAECISSLSVNDRVVMNFIQSSKIHYFPIDNLQESTEYHYSIVSGGETYDDTSFITQTAKKPSGVAPVSDIAWGKVYNSDHTVASYALIYIVIPEASPLSALTTSNGNWNISFANSYNLEKNNWFTPLPNINEDIYVISQDGQTTQITGNTSRNNPVPDIIIGQDTFTMDESPSYPVGEIDYSSDNPSTGEITIQNPSNGETISTLRPDFFGTADPNHTFEISLSGPVNASGNPVSDSGGVWHWSPTSSLTPGSYVIRAENVEYNFTVSAESSSLAYTASDSGQLNTPTPTFAPIQPTDTPAYLSPTAMPTPTTVIVPTSTKEPTPRTYKPSTDSGVPKTGNSFPTIVLSILSISLLAFGFLLI